MSDTSTEKDTISPNETREDMFSVAQAIALMRSDTSSTSSNQERRPLKRRIQNEAKDNQKQLSTSMDVDVFDRPIQLKHSDVLSERGSAAHRHPGNHRFWKILAPFRQEYQSLSRRDVAKQDIANQVYTLVCQGGVRFIKRNRENGLLEELSEEKCLDKIKHGLRTVCIPAFLMETELDQGSHDGSCVGDPQETTGNITTGQATLHAQTQWNIERKHSPMSESVYESDDEDCTFEDDDTTGSFADVQKDPVETAEIMRDVTDQFVNELTHVDNQSTRPNHAYESPNDADTRVGRHFEPQSQQVHVSIHEDEEEVRLFEIPQDVPGKPGKEWMTSPAILGRIVGHVANPSTLTTR